MKYFIGLLASIALIILVVFLIIRGLTGRSDNGDQQRPAALVTYADTDTTVSMTVDGRINADQEHNAYEITVGRSEVIIETYQGYEETVIDQVSYPSNEEAYANFLRAIDLAGFTKGNTEDSASDYRGVCPNGARYILKITSGTHERQRFWATSCGDQGTFQGRIASVRQLFNRQVPDFSRLTNRLHLQ